MNITDVLRSPANTAQALAMNFDELNRPKKSIVKKSMSTKIAVIGTGNFSIKPTVDDWIEYAKKEKVFPSIIEHIKTNNHNVFTLRSWKCLDTFLKNEGIKKLTTKELNRMLMCALILKKKEP